MTETAEPTTTETVTTEAEPTPVETTDHAAEAEKWKALARKQEQRAKENAEKAKQYDALKAEQMSELDKAVEAAKQEGYNNALKASASRLVDAEVRAAIAGRSIDGDALLDGLDRSRFVTDDGDVDTDAIAKWVDRIAPKSDSPTRVDIGQGSRGAAPTAVTNPLEAALRDKLGISA